MNEAQKNDHLQQVYPQFINASYAEDEINLVDVWIALIQYKKVFWAVFSSLAILGLLFALFVFNERYMLNSALEIGSIGSNGTIKELETPESLKSKLSNVLVPKITAQYLLENPGIGPFQTTISSSKGSEIVLIQNKVKESQIELFTRYQNILADNLIQDHDKKIEFYQADLKAELNTANDKLQQLKLPEALQSKLDKILLMQRTEQSKLSHTEHSYKLIQQGGTESILTDLSDEERKLMSQNGVINQQLLNIRYQQVLLWNRIQQDDIRKGLENANLEISDIKRSHKIEIEQQQRVVESIQAKARHL